MRELRSLVLNMTYQIKVAKPVVILSLLFLFALGIQAGMLLRFIESQNQLNERLQSLDKTVGP